MEKFRRLVVTNYFIPFSGAFYLIFELLIFYLLNLIFLKSVGYFIFFILVIFKIIMFKYLTPNDATRHSERSI